MNDLEDRARELLLALAHNWEAVDGVQELPEGGWALLLHEDRRFDLGVDARRGVLVIATVAGPPHAGRLLECFEALLSYNMLWDKTGGARMALGGSGGEVALLMDVPLEGLVWATVESVLRNLDDVALAWREFLAKPPEEPAEFLRPGQFA